MSIKKFMVNNEVEAEDSVSTFHASKTQNDEIALWLA